MRWTAPVVLLLLAACASAPTTMQSASLAAARDSYTMPGMLVTGAQLGSNAVSYAPHETVWEVLYRRNPKLLSDRGTRGGLASGEDPIGVYLGDHYMGGPDVLKTVFARDVFRVERLTSSEAQTRYPRHHDNGVILVTMRR